MPLRNGAHGYGAVTKSLHWLTVAALTGQFVVGYTMDADDGSGRIPRTAAPADVVTDPGLLDGTRVQSPEAKRGVA